MKISKRQLKRIIREEKLKLDRQRKLSESWEQRDSDRYDFPDDPGGWPDRTTDWFDEGYNHCISGAPEDPVQIAQELGLENGGIDWREFMDGFRTCQDDNSDAHLY